MAAQRQVDRMSYHPQRVTKRRPCEICGRDHYCGYDPLAGVAFCPKVANQTGATFGAWGYIHKVGATPTEYNAHLARTSRPEVILTPGEAEARNLLYGEMAVFCKISTDDFIDLTTRRGMTAAQAKRHGYFTYPGKAQRRALADHLETIAATGSTVARRWNKAHSDHTLDSAMVRLPGRFTQAKRGKWGGYITNLAGPDDDTLAIPVKDVNGNTVAIRLRIDAQHSPTGKKQVKWLSSSERSGGTSPGSPIHVAKPEAITDARIWITEGEIKANLAADVLGAICVSIPGYTNWHALPETMDALKAAGYLATEVVVALDQDSSASTHANVQKEASAIACAMTQKGFTANVATWDAKDGKGLDDLLMAKGMPTITPFAAPRQRGLVATAPVTYGADSNIVSMMEAEFQLEEAAKQIFPAKWPRGLKAMETIVLMATMGLGKTYNMLKRLDELDRNNAWPKIWSVKNNSTRDVRVLVLFDDMKILAEQTEKYFGAVWTQDQYDENGVQKSRWVWNYAANSRPTFYVTEGRNAAPNSGGYCANMALAGEVSERRGLPIVDACRIGKDVPCPFAEDCQIGGYLAGKKAAKTARIVCACKSAYLNESKELDDFDLVIMDEDTAHAFLEEISITSGDVDQWRKLLAERDPIGEFWQLEKFLAWMQAASNHAKAHGEGMQSPAMQHFRATAPADALDVLQYARAAAQWDSGGRNRTFYRAICEVIRDNDRAIPLRALHDITQGLLNEWERHPEADTRLRFTDAGTLTYRHPRLGLIMRLFARRVAILDATGDPQALKRIHAVATSEMATTPPFTVHHVQVRHNIRLTQISDSLYGRKALGKDGGVKWHAIEETVAAMAKRLGIGNKEVARLTFKLFDPNDATSETAGDDTFVTGHYGLDNKATNRFFNDETKCRMLVTIGNYVPNIGEITAVVEAWRFSADPRETGKHFVTVCYPGKAEGVERPVADDPDIQRAIQHATWAAETQALGRMRDVRRPGEVLHWIRFNRDPYIPPGDEFQAVPVATLTAHNHLRTQLGLPTIEVYTSQQKAPLKAENERRRKEAEAKCQAAADALAAEGKELTANALAHRAGVNFNRAKVWLSSYTTTKEASAPPPQTAKAPRPHVDPATVPMWPASATSFLDRLQWLKERYVDDDQAIAFILAQKHHQAVYAQGVN